jgi:hypothetical protein
VRLPTTELVKVAGNNKEEPEEAAAEVRERFALP